MFPDSTPAHRPVEPQAGVLVHSRAERELAVGQWLLLAAPDTGRARTEWSRTGIALLACGALFAAVRLSARLVHAASGTDDEQRIDDFLAEALHGGPAFVDLHIQRYYALVPRSTADRKEWRGCPYDAHAECLEPGSFLGVPSPIQISPSLGRSRWCVPMDGPGDLCGPESVYQLVTYGRYRLAEQGEADR
ncbi:hypothetical protein [Streptomyces sp. NPDC046909]|uniref:hypothetical protein n=1 Tax=Streptomyces sp. NPDC046909 TaxID=3155617 RepID=UPI0033EAE8CD